MENDLSASLKILLFDANLLMLEYERKFCRKCIETSNPTKQNCGLLRGFSKPFCSKMESWVDKKQEKEIKKIGELLFTAPEQSAYSKVIETY